MNEMENMEIKEEVTEMLPESSEIEYDIVLIDEAEECENGTFGGGMLVGSLVTAALVGVGALVKKVVIPKIKLRKARKAVEQYEAENVCESEIVETEYEELLHKF